jgi:hypothetical protein
MGQYNLCWRQECLTHCFPLRIELPFERNIAYLSGFSNVKNITFVQNSSIQMNGRSSVSHGRKPSVLESGWSYILFPCENRVNLWKECLLSESVLKWENHSLYEKYPLQMKLRNTCILWNNKVCVSCRSFMHIVFLEEPSYLLKGILPISQSFQAWGTPPLWRIVPFKWMEKALYVLEKTT